MQSTAYFEQLLQGPLYGATMLTSWSRPWSAEKQAGDAPRSDGMNRAAMWRENRPVQNRPALARIGLPFRSVKFEAASAVHRP